MAKLFTRLITSFIILIIVALLALLIGVRSQTTPPPLPCMSAEDREFVRYLALDAIDKAFQIQVEHLFDIWMKSPEQQPKRASNGMQTAISAHARARADAMKWNPPKCT